MFDDSCKTCRFPPAGEPGLCSVPAAADRVRAEPHDAGRHAAPGGPAAETAPPGGGGEAQVPEPGGAADPAAAVSSQTGLIFNDLSSVFSINLNTEKISFSCFSAVIYSYFHGGLRLISSSAAVLVCNYLLLCLRFVHSDVVYFLRSDLEKSVEELQRNSSINHGLVTEQDVEQKSKELRMLGDTLAELKSRWSGLPRRSEHA